MRAITGRAFQAHIISPNLVNLLKYLNYIITSLDDAWPELVGNLNNVMKRWVWLLIILRREGVNPRVSGMFFKAVVQVVLLFGSEMWVMTPAWDGTLGGSTQGSYMDHWEVSPVVSGRKLAVPTFGDDNAGGGV